MRSWAAARAGSVGGSSMSVILPIRNAAFAVSLSCRERPPPNLSAKRAL